MNRKKINIRAIILKKITKNIRNKRMKKHILCMVGVLVAAILVVPGISLGISASKLHVPLNSEISEPDPVMNSLPVGEQNIPYENWNAPEKLSPTTHRYSGSQADVYIC